MIFALGDDGPAAPLFVMLSESDVADKLRPGHTLYVDPALLGGRTFGHVVISLGKTDQDNVALLHKAAPETRGMAPRVREPGAAEARCKGPCKGVQPEADLFEGKCTVCWATQAKALLRMLN
jgi:hypothetical protein